MFDKDYYEQALKDQSWLEAGCPAESQKNTKHNRETKVSAEDNAFLKLYNHKWLEGIELSRQEESQFDRLGRKYTHSDNWYYQYDRYEEWYYVVQE